MNQHENKRQVRIYFDDKGRKQATLAASEKPEDELCDFCSQHSPPYKVYPCKDFRIPGTLHNSLGEWNACTECAALIDGNDHGALAIRCAKLIEGEHSPESFLMLHGLFFENRIYTVSEVMSDLGKRPKTMSPMAKQQRRDAGKKSGEARRRPGSAPPEPKGAQPGSPEPPASSHNPKGDSPDEDLSK